MAASVAILMAELALPGGAERLAFEEAQHLAASGYRTRLLTFSYDPHVRFDGRYTAAVDVLPRPVALGPLARTVALTWWLLRERPDLVIASSAFDAAYLWPAALIARVPYLVHIHGTVMWDQTDATKYARMNRAALHRILARSPFHAAFVPGRPRPTGLSRRLGREAVAWSYRTGVRRAVERLVLTERIAWEVKELYGVTPFVGKGRFPAALLEHRSARDPLAGMRLGGPLILNVNRLDPRKRVDLIVRAFQRVHREIPAAVLVIGGTGPSEPALRALAADLGVADHVRFAGYIPESDLYDAIQHADLFVHMNWAENALAPLEALAVGTKVVWSSEMEVGSEIAATGLASAADPTPEATAEAILRALRQPRPQADRRPLEAYTWERYFDEIARIVARVCRPS